MDPAVGALRFTATAYQNEYLPEHGDRIDVVVRCGVDGDGRGSVSAAPGDAEFVILLDCSGSMGDPPTKLSQARRAAAAAVAALRDGVAFAVVAGTDTARMRYPTEPTLAIASEATRSAAAAATLRARAGGGTAIGRWLALADELFSHRDDVVRHALLLTDGKNQHESLAEFDGVLARCQRRFRCDTRAVGAGGGPDGWSGAELLRIAQAMSGSVQNISDVAELPANLVRATTAAMGRSVPDLRLRVRTTDGTTLRFVKQVHPAINDLTARGADVDARTRDHPTGAWGPEHRDYHLAFTVVPRPPGTELRIAWVALVSAAADADPVELAEVPVVARWTRDPRESTRINAQVAHYTGQSELADRVRAGVEAYRAGRHDDARRALGRAVELAHVSGHADSMRELSRLVVVDDAARGVVRLRDDIDPTGVESVVLASVRTTGFDRPDDGRPAAPALPGSGEPCPLCATPRVDRYCEQDGYDFAGATGPGGG